MLLLVNHKLTEDIYTLLQKLMLKDITMSLQFSDQQQKVRQGMLMDI
jgi:hypothetical protein